MISEFIEATSTPIINFDKLKNVSVTFELSPEDYSKAVIELREYTHIEDHWNEFFINFKGIKYHILKKISI